MIVISGYFDHLEIVHKYLCTIPGPQKLCTNRLCTNRLCTPRLCTNVCTNDLCTIPQCAQTGCAQTTLCTNQVGDPTPGLCTKNSVPTLCTIGHFPIVHRLIVHNVQIVHNRVYAQTGSCTNGFMHNPTPPSCRRK